MIHRASRYSQFYGPYVELQYAKPREDLESRLDLLALVERQLGRSSGIPRFYSTSQASSLASQPVAWHYCGNATFGWWWLQGLLDASWATRHPAGRSAARVMPFQSVRLAVDSEYAHYTSYSASTQQHGCKRGTDGRLSLAAGGDSRCELSSFTRTAKCTTQTANTAQTAQVGLAKVDVRPGWS